MGAQKLIHTELLYTQGAQELIPTKFSTLLHTQGAQKLIRAKFSTLVRTQGAQKLVRAEFSTNEVVVHFRVN